MGGLIWISKKQQIALFLLPGGNFLSNGPIVTCKGVKTVGNDVWMQTPSGWIAAVYQGKTYIK